MNTSGVAEPPEISVASVARLVSVLVGADVSVTWIFGYFFSNALISTVRVSVAPAPAIGLADHTILPEVAEPDAELVAPPPPPPPPPALLPPLLPPQPARTSAPATPTTAVICLPLRRPWPGYLRDPMVPPLKVVTL